MPPGRRNGRAGSLGPQMATGDPDLTAALDGITPDEYGPFLGFVGQIHQYAGDRLMLAGVRSLVEESGALGEPQRAYLLRRIDKLLEV